MAFEPLTPDRRRAMTRRHLLDAAAIVFARDGFHGATLDEVAKTAGFTKGAVYSNFKSKDDLFLALIDDRAERAYAVIEEILDTQPQHSSDEQLPRVRELMHSDAAMWDDTWQALYLEFLLYARRTPEGRAKLAQRDRYERAAAEHFIESEYAARGTKFPYPVREFASVMRAVFLGLNIERLADPDSVTTETIDTALDLLYEFDRIIEQRSATKEPRASGE